MIKVFRSVVVSNEKMQGNMLNNAGKQRQQDLTKAQLIKVGVPLLASRIFQRGPGIAQAMAAWMAGLLRFGSLCLAFVFACAFIAVMPSMIPGGVMPGLFSLTDVFQRISSKEKVEIHYILANSCDESQSERQYWGKPATCQPWGGKWRVLFPAKEQKQDGAQKSNPLAGALPSVGSNSVYEDFGSVLRCAELADLTLSCEFYGASAMGEKKLVAFEPVPGAQFGSEGRASLLEVISMALGIAPSSSSASAYWYWSAAHRDSDGAGLWLLGQLGMAGLGGVSLVFVSLLACFSAVVVGLLATLVRAGAREVGVAVVRSAGFENSEQWRVEIERKAIEESSAKANSSNPSSRL